MSRKVILPESFVISPWMQNGGARLARQVPGQPPRMPSGEEPLSTSAPRGKELDVDVGALVEGEEADAAKLDQ